MSPRRLCALHLATLVAARVLATIFAWRAGFHALSDDDFARVVIAQQFSQSPRLDPSGTSWLPLPFWVTGSAMMIVEPSLELARGLALVTASLASALLYAVARLSGISPGGAFLGALAATLMPLSIFAGAATVPELPTATLAACSLLLLRRTELPFRLAASAAILPATLCRYEVRPLAILVAAVSWLPIRSSDPPPARHVAWRAAAFTLALLGPVAWIAWNAHAHGDPLHFHTRVSSFWSSYLSRHGAPLRAWLGGYPATALLHVPEATLLGFVALSVSTRSVLRSWTLPAAGVTMGIVALMLAAATGGAPTHHPERPLLFVWLVACFAIADLMDRARPSIARRVRIAGALAATAVIAWFALQARGSATTCGIQRRTEVEAGRWLRDNTSGAVVVDPIDYGYFAIEAALERPGQLRLAGSVDPRHGVPDGGDAARLQRAVREADAQWLVVPEERAPSLGEERRRIGRWVVLCVGPSTRCAWQKCRSR